MGHPDTSPSHHAQMLWPYSSSSPGLIPTFGPLLVRSPNSNVRKVLEDGDLVIRQESFRSLVLLTVSVSALPEADVGLWSDTHMGLCFQHKQCHHMSVGFAHLFAGFAPCAACVAQRLEELNDVSCLKVCWWKLGLWCLKKMSKEQVCCQLNRSRVSLSEYMT